MKNRAGTGRVLPVLLALMLVLALAPVPAELRAQTAAPADTAPADGLTLQACYQEALLNDPEIRKARAGFEQATGDKLVLQSRALPQVVGGVVGGEQGPRYNTADPKKKIFILVTGSLTQPVYDAGIPASFRRGRIGLAIAEQQFNRSAMAELYAIRVAFYDALNARSNIEVQESIRNRLAANLKSQQDQLAVGKVSRREVGQATYQLSSIGPGIAAARLAYDQARIELARRLGRDLGADAAAAPDQGLPTPVGSLEAETVDVDVEAECAYALAHRPDLLALRSLIAATKEDATIAHADALPLIDFVSNLQYIPQTAVHKTGGVVQAGNDIETTQLLAGLSFTWTPVDGGAVRGAMATVNATRESYQLSLQQLEAGIPGAIRQAAAALKQAAAQLQGSEQNIALADENLRQVEAQVSNGDLPQLDFINAQSNLLQARFNRLNALLENNLAIAQLDILTGRYLEFVDTTASGAARH